jgi:hypothetical protein
MLSPNKPLPPDFTYNFPADLKNVISYTTLKVLEGGNIPTLLTRNVNELEKEEEEAEREPMIPLSEDTIDYTDLNSYDRILYRPKVKKEDEEKKRERLLYEKPSLDISLPHVSVSYFFYSIFIFDNLFFFSFIDSHLSSPENSSYGSNQSTSHDTERF